MALNSAIAVYYYLKLIVFMFLKDPSQNDGTIYYTNGTFPLKLILTIAALFVIVSIVTIEPLLGFIQDHVVASGF